MKPKYKKAIIAGGRGFIGSAFLRYASVFFEEVHVLTRHALPQNNNIHYHEWDAENPGNWMALLEGADLLLNLTGKSVNCRYTAENKKAILNTRINSTLILGAAVIMANKPPKVWINSSTATIYRHAMDRPNTESNGITGDDFSMTVAKKWEQTFFDIPITGTRRVALRAAIVLGNEGGALPVMRRLAQFGLGGHQGSGEQKVSWIHEEDLIRSIMHILEHEELEGCINASAPHPTNNLTLTHAIARRVNMPIAIHQPEWMLKLGALLIGTEVELVLKSRWVLPERLLGSGFTFQFGTIHQALDNLLGESESETSRAGATVLTRPKGAW